MLGNGWEWTSAVFAGFEGFVARDYNPGYSRNLFDGRHGVLKGASVRTACLRACSPCRNWFRADYPIANTMFRLVRR